KDKSRLLKTLVAFAICLVLVSCAATRMYSGPELANSQVAIIQSADLTVTIESLDGKRTPSSRIAVLPGEHTIEMSFDDRMPGGWVYWSVNNFIFSFIAQAGHTYSVDWKMSPDNYRTYFVVLKDKTTGEHVPYTSTSPTQPMDMYFDAGLYRD
ncbi:MAG TPA: hypothetical protein VHO84_03680, partial [Syntrophorhabdaceae bacterium]|nr:hypothetical protein [Syntrophorhabdaceae bacterium]